MATDSLPHAGAKTEPRLWLNVSFMLMWSSVAASGFGDRLIQLAAWALLGIDQPNQQASAIQAGVYFFFFVPYLIFSPVGGWLADTLPRKWIMLACDEGRGLLLLWAMLLVPAGAAVVIPADHHWKIYGLILLVGVLAAIFSPTRNATIPQIVPTRQLQSANAIILGIATIASLIGLIVGSRIIEDYSVKAGLTVGVLLYMVSGTFFGFLRIRPQPASSAPERRPGQIERLVQALGYIRRHRAVMELVLLSVVFWSAANVFLAAMAALCKRRYGIPAEQLKSAIAIMGGVVGFGMLASALWVAWQSSRRESAWIAMIGLNVAGLCLLLMAFNPWYYGGLVLAFLAGFAGNTAMICVATLMQSLTPNYILGRVFGARELLTTISIVSVNLVIWLLPAADAWMVPVLIATAAVLLLLSLRGLWVQLTNGPMPLRMGNVFWRVCRAYVLVWHRLRWVGRHNIPSHGPAILASNHTTAVDPQLIQAIVPRSIRWVMTTPYMFRILNPLWNVIQPIALKPEASNLGNMRLMLDALKHDQIVALFPEGRLQREHRDLGEFQPGIALLAARSGAAILPVWVAGTPRKHHILWHYLHPSHSTVVFGRPFHADPDMSHEDVLAEIRRRMVELADQV